MKKLFVSLMLFLVALVANIVAPFGYLQTSSLMAEYRENTIKASTIEKNLSNMQGMATEAVISFNDFRIYDIDYSNVGEIIERLTREVGVEIQSAVEVDITSNFAEVRTYSEGSNSNAVRLDILATDPEFVVDMLNDMQLPVCEFKMEAPNTVSVTFLTGGSI